VRGADQNTIILELSITISAFMDAGFGHPYLQKITASGITVIWWTWDDTPGIAGVIWWEWTEEPGGLDDFNYLPKGKPNF